MKTYFLHENADSKELVLFFGGFASHPSHFAHLDSNKNVLMSYDYEDFDLDLNLDSFEKIILVAFSMGVCVANRILIHTDFYPKIARKIAINGTNFGIDKELGIHPSLFLRTMKNFSLEVFKKALFAQHLSLAKDFIFEQETKLRKELENLWDFANKERKNFLFWDRAFASKNDEIFPPQALENSFSKLDLIEEPHFAFFYFKTWDEF